jgi:hypothetical protein
MHILERKKAAAISTTQPQSKSTLASEAWRWSAAKIIAASERG